MSMTSSTATSFADPHCETLAYGQFYGACDRRFEIPQFSLGLFAPDDTWARRKKHSHDATHMIFVLGGDYVLSVDRRETTLPPRSLIFVPAGTTHENYPATPRTQVLTVSVAESLVEQALDYVRLPDSESDFRHGEIAFLANRLELECRSWGNASPLTASGLCLELLGAVGRSTESKERTPPRWLETARELLNDRCCEAITIGDIASAVGIHPIHLSRTFRRFFGCTAGEYLRKCRIEKAARLLRSGSMLIADVALQSGFSDQSHFSKAFRQRFGITPVEFRQRSSNEV
jgi:AraC family transcriptional regulator